MVLVMAICDKKVNYKEKEKLKAVNQHISFCED